MRTKENAVKIKKALEVDLEKNNVNKDYTITGEVYDTIMTKHITSITEYITLLDKVEQLERQLAAKPRIIYRVR